MASENEYAWISDASCAGMPLSDFFVEAGRVASSSVLRRCRTCPVRAECLTDAYNNEFAKGGYRGGFSPSARNRTSFADAMVVVTEESSSYRIDRS